MNHVERNIRVSRLLVLSAVLVIVALPAMSKQAAACSNASLKGTYGVEWGWPQEMFGFSGNEGMIVGQITFDGTGTYSGEETVSFENSIETESISGTYSIAANCTGTLGGAFNIYLNGSNNGFQMAITAPGDQALGFALPQVSDTCALSGKEQRLGLNLVGTIPNSSENKDIVGELELNGKGKLSGTVSINVNYSNTVYTVTGSYTESNCTGTLQMSGSGLPALNFNTVFVNGGKELLLIETDSGTVIGGTAQ
jgi:hypothetical protein